MNTNNEKNSIRISIILILLAFMLIYKLFIDKNQDIISDIIYNSWTSSQIDDWLNNSNKWSFIVDSDLVLNQNSYKISGTDIVTDELLSLSVLKLPYKYITKWPNSIYIVYLDKFDQNIKNKMMYENSGNYKIINTERQKIIDQVEWDEIIYINNSSRKWKLVVFIVTKWLNSRLVQVNKDDYYKYKKYIYYNLTN